MGTGRIPVREQQSEKQIEVVGAGAAGLVAAINLARAGYGVRVYEASPTVGHRFHGDFQGLENWSSIEDVTVLLERLGIYGEPHRDFILRPYNEIEVFDANLNRTVVNSKRAMFYLVERGDGPACLDRRLLEIAREAGVRVVFNTRVERLGKGGIIGIGPRAADAIARGLVFKTTMEDKAAAILDDSLAPKGYAYLLVHKGKGTMATCMFREFRTERQCFERTVETFRKVFPALRMTDEVEFGGYGNFFFGRPVYENGKYYIGEAAGFQDCLWGFGMRYAFVSGWLAARSIIEGGASAPLLYVSLLRDELVGMHRTSLANRFLFERLGNRGYNHFIKKLAEGEPVEFLRKQYNPSFLKRILFPVASWRFKSRLVDKGCHTEDCTCVWCRCRKEPC